MIRRFAIASLLTVSSAAGLSSASFAQTVDGVGTVNFSADNLPACSVITSPVTGTFTPSATQNGLTTALSGSGTVQARCNRQGTSSASAPFQISGPTLTLGTPTITQGLDVPGNGDITNVTVSLTATPPSGSSVIPAGEYAYAVTVTVSP